MRRVTESTYRNDPLYPRVTRAAHSLLERGDVVAPVDALVEMGLLAKDRLEDWRRAGACPSSSV